MGKPAFRYVAYGECPNCGKQMIRNAECTVAVCTCSSAVKVSLKPTMLFRTNSRLYGKLEKTAKKVNVEVEELVDKTFETALNNKEFMVETIKKLRGTK